MNDRTKKAVAAGFVLCFLCVFLSVWCGRSLGENVAFLFEYKKSLPKIKMLESSISQVPSNIKTDDLKAEIEESKYDSTKLSSDISNEMSKNGMVVMDVSVKQTAGKEVRLTVKGAVSADRLYDFVLGISSVRKLFFVDRLEISPRNSSVQIINRMDQIRNNPKQLQALKTDVKRSDLEMFNVTLEVLVVTA
jgi:hypothetical protein